MHYFKKLERCLQMSSNDIAISVKNLSKCYQIYETPRDRVKQAILPRLNRLTGKEPNRYFREFWALKDVSFEVKKGETVGIIGRNGSGKSTLLQLICGTLSPTQGSVVVNGRVAALLELGAGFNPEFTGRENVYMSAAILGLTKDEIDTRLDDIAAFADIGQFIEQPVKTYSSGMYVRLAFAVNIVSDPEIMIVDEALAVGDMAFQAKCMTALTRIQDRGATVLFVSHDIGALKSLCSQGVYLQKGVVKKIGPAGDVAEQYVRSMREEMNSDFSLNGKPEQLKVGVDTQTLEPISMSEFKVGVEFERRVASFRYGDGGVKITFAELLDEDLNPINEVRFNQCVNVKIYFESDIQTNVGCNYYILDDKRNLILGASLDLINIEQPLMSIKSGGKYIVTYKTRLPLQEGSYSVQLQIVSPLVLNHSAKFLDVIDNAVVFKVAVKDGSRIWTKAFVENHVEINSCL